MCNMLKDYQQIIKDVPIIIGYEEYKELGTWVITQRGLYHKGEQSEERIQKLEDIGFFWSKEEEDWNFKFNQLRMYQDKHGDCLVPTGYADNKELAYWVSLQRKQYKLGTLKQSKVNKLNDLGFRWNPKKKIGMANMSYSLNIKMQMATVWSINIIRNLVHGLSNNEHYLRMVH